MLFLKSLIAAAAVCLSLVALAAGSEDPIAEPAKPAGKLKQDVQDVTLIDERASRSAAAVAEVQALADAGKFVEAEAAAQKAIAGLKDDAKLYNLLGFALRNQKKYEQSIAAYRAAIRLQPDFPQAKEYLAVAYLKRGRVKEARKLHAELKATHPDLAAMIETEAKKAKVKW